jgi:hypothetical protein
VVRELFKKPPTKNRKDIAVPVPASSANTRKEGGALSSQSETGEAIMEKARDYIKKKEEAISNIKEKLGRELLTYKAIGNSNIRSRVASNILGDSMSDGPTVPGWVNMGDGRFLSGGLNMALNSWRIISTSFNGDWTCLRCSPHGGKPALKIRGEAESSCSLQAILLVDQSFPAILPAAGNQQCMKIIAIKREY